MKSTTKLKKAKHVRMVTDNGLVIYGKIRVTTLIHSLDIDGKPSVGFGAEITELREVRKSAK